MKTLFKRIILALALVGLTMSINLDGMKRKFDEIENSEEKINESIPLYKKYLEMYDNLSSEELSNLESFWKSNSFKSALKDDIAIQIIIDIATHLSKYYPNQKTKIFLLGQSPAYIGLTAQLLEALGKKNPNRYNFIAFSGFKSSVTNDFANVQSAMFNINFSLLSSERLKDAIQVYYHYLKSINFFTQDSKEEIVVVEQIESGSSMAAFECVLEKIKELKLLEKDEFIPVIKWYILTASEYKSWMKDLKKWNKKTLHYAITVQVDHKEFWKKTTDIEYRNSSCSLIYSLNDFEHYRLPDEGQRTKSIIKEFPSLDFSTAIDEIKEYPTEIIAADREELRLVMSYPIDKWNTSINPHHFVPDKEAELRILRIINYIKQQQEKESNEKKIEKKE